MEFTANKNKEISIETSTGDYDRCAIQTHFVQIGEDYIELVERYVKPLWQEGDLLAIAEKIVSLCQNNVIPKKDMKVTRSESVESPENSVVTRSLSWAGIMKEVSMT